MERIPAARIISIAAQMERIEALMGEWKNDKSWDGNKEFPAKERGYIAAQYANLSKSAAAMGADVSSEAAADVARKIRARKDPVSFNKLSELNRHVQSVLYIEIGGVEFYCMKGGASQFYNPKEPIFGNEVEENIPRASNDISEAGKCFATARYTASVFHLMRAVEASLRDLSSDLGVENSEREWGILLSEINKKIEKMPKGAEKDNWSQVHANLYHVKQAWRNETMHPKATYTEEEAKEVFDAMRAFCRHLATMLNPIPSKG